MQSVPTVPASIQALAKLPSREIIPLLPAATPVLNLSTPSKEDLEQTKSFMDELESLPIGQIKQKLGEKLFKVIKKSGIKRAVSSALLVQSSLVSAD
jgi:polyadenylate-binding protein